VIGTTKEVFEVRAKCIKNEFELFCFRKLNKNTVFNKYKDYFHVKRYFFKNHLKLNFELLYKNNSGGQH
jgi:hypothetical protein